MKKLLLELHDQDVGMDSKKMNNPQKRTAARAVILDGKKIALLYVAKYDFHKLPGGGAKKGETIQETLFREIDEETGCKVKVVKEIGSIVEHRSHLNVIQTSHCFIVRKLEQNDPRFEQDELDDGFRLEWHDINSATELLVKENKKRYDNYEGNFIVRRDLRILQVAKEILDLRHPGL